MASEVRINATVDTGQADKAVGGLRGALKNLGHEAKSSILTGFGLGSGIGAWNLLSDGISKVVDLAGTIIPIYEKVHAQELALNTALKDHGESMDRLAPRIEAAIKSGEQWAFSADDTREAIIKLTEAGNSFGDIEKDLPVIMDLARAKHMSLTDAARQYELALMGNQRALKDLGIIMPKVTTSIVGQRDATGHLATAQSIAADKAHRMQLLNAALTGAIGDQRSAITPLERAQVKMGDAWEKFSTKVAPALVIALGWVIDKISTLVDWLVTLVGWIADAVGWFTSLFKSARSAADMAATAVPGHPEWSGGAPGGKYPQRASGGPVLPGGIYTVGEHGPETLVMGGSGGYVIPNAGGGGGMQVIQLVVDGRTLAEVVNRANYYTGASSSVLPG